MDCRISLKGHLDPSWQEWLAGLTIHHQDSGVTLLTGSLPDQAALYGVLATLRRLNLNLLSLETGDAPLQREEHTREMGPHTHPPKPTERASTDEYNHKQC